MSNKPVSYPVRYLRAGLWRVHPDLAQSPSFAEGVRMLFFNVPERLRDDAVGNVYVALLEAPANLSEAEALRLVNLVATTFVQDESKERGAVRRNKDAPWRKLVAVDRLVSPDDPVRAVELDQTASAINDLILSQPAERRQALAMLADATASPADRSVRHVMAVTGLSRRTVAGLQKQLERVAAGLNLHDSATGPSAGTEAATGLGKLAAAVAQRPDTPARHTSDDVEPTFDKPRRRSTPVRGINGFA